MQGAGFPGDSPARNEIGMQMQSIKNEWQETVSDLQSGVQMPSGMSRAEFQQWKAEQTDRAKKRLTELEDRLQRLQLLDNKLKKLKSNGDDTVHSVPDSWALPNQVNGHHDAGMTGYGYGHDMPPPHTSNGLPHYAGAQGYVQPAPAPFTANPAMNGGYYNGNGNGYYHANGNGHMPASRPMTMADPSYGQDVMFFNGNGNQTRPATHQWNEMDKSLNEEINGSGLGNPPASGHNGGPALYTRPVTPGTIRQIIREEMHKPEVKEGKTAQESADGEESAEAHEKVEEAKVPGKLQRRTPKPVEESEVNWDQVLNKTVEAEAAFSAGKSMYQKPKKPGEPQVIEDATPISCPLLFGGFSRRSPIRLQCFEIYQSTMWASVFLLVTLANSIYIAIAPELIAEGLNAEKSSTERLLEYFEYFCVFVLFFEIVVGIISLGFVQAPNSYLRVSDFHKMDFLVFVVTAVEYVFKYLGATFVTLRPFRLLRVFRAITRIKTFAGIKAIITTLRQGLMQLAIVLTMLIFFMFALSICGMAVYRKSFRRRCVSIEMNIPACATNLSDGWRSSCNFKDLTQTTKQPAGIIAISGGYPFEKWCKRITNSTPGQYDGEYPLDPFGRYHTCQMNDFKEGLPITQMCEDVGNPVAGLSHYDHVGGAMTSLGQVVAPDSSYDVLWRSLDSEPDAQAVTWIIYFITSCLCTFLLLGLFVAVVTGTFKRVRQQHGTAFRDVEAEEEDAEAAERKKEEKMMLEKQKKLQRQQAGIEEEEDGDEAMQLAAQSLIANPRFHHFIMLTIATNAVAWGADQHDAPQSWRDYSYYTYVVCNMIFFIELTLRFLAAGSVGEFWKSKFHKFELFMVIVGLLGVTTNQKVLLLLPAARLYRLMSYLPTLEALLLSAVASVKAIVNLCLFICVVGISFAVTGRYFFSTSMNDITRSNFGSFSLAVLTVFQLLTGDSWSSVMYSAMQSKSTTFGQIFSALFVLAWFVFSALIVNNLFVAVIIENFEVSKTINDIGKPGKIAAIRKMISDSYRGLYERSSAVLSGHLEVDVNTGQTVAAGHKGKFALTERHGKGGDRQTYEEELENDSDEYLIPNQTQQVSVWSSNSAVMAVVRGVTIPKTAKNEDDEDEDEPERVLFCLLPNNPVRRFFIWLGNQPLFDTIVYVSILSSCFFLMVTPPYEDIPDQPPLISFAVMSTWNTVFTFVFTVEFGVRIMSQGLIFTKRAYLKDGWNIVDTLVLFFAWVDESGILTEGGIAKVFRLARALRPLRLMKRNQGMRVVIDALISTLMPVAYVIVFSLFTGFVFALVGMGLFGGMLRRCNTPVAPYPMGKVECVGLYANDRGILIQSVWHNPDYHFDTFVHAAVALFRVSTIKYVGILWDCMDITEFEKSPKLNNKEYHAFFFVAYLLVGALFVMNLFVGFIVDGFNANKGSSEADIQYSRFERQISTNRPVYDTFKNPEWPVSVAVRRFVHSRPFQTFSAGCVFANVIFMLADHADSTESFSQIILWQNTIFFGELVWELLLYTVGFGFGGFYNDPWKGFDFFVACGTAASYGASNERIGQIAKSFRLLRVVRLMKMIKPIRVILETLIQSVPQLANIILLLFLVYSMFAVVAVQMFGTTKYGIRLGPTANFNSYPNALYTVWQLVTGDEWHDLLTDCLRLEPFCFPKFVKSDNYDGPDYSWGDCGNTYATTFFVAFKLVCENVMLNLFIGMILDNFSFITDEVAQNEDEFWTNGASTEQIQALARQFMKFDAGTGRIPISSLHGLLVEMDRPMGFKDWDGTVRISRFDKATELLIRGELNVLVRHERSKDEEAKKSIWNRIRCSVRRKQRFVTGMDFEDVLMTILYWRMPRMIPRVVKFSRHARIEEVVLMSHALTVMDFFNSLVARRKKKETKLALQDRTIFTTWSKTDSHRKRRTASLETKRTEEKDRAQRMHKTVFDLQTSPSETNTVELHQTPVIPEDITQHFAAVRELHAKQPKPIHGIEIFRTWAATHHVVVKFIDPAKADYGYFIADFTQVKWAGWHLRNAEHDTYFEPETFDFHKNHKNAEPWTKIDVLGRVDAALLKMGSVQDLQSYVMAETERGGKKSAVANSCLRINLGNILFSSNQSNVNYSSVNAKGMSASLDDEKNDGVVQVLGYIPADPTLDTL